MMLRDNLTFELFAFAPAGQLYNGSHNQRLFGYKLASNDGICYQTNIKHSKVNLKQDEAGKQNSSYHWGSPRLGKSLL